MLPPLVYVFFEECDYLTARLQFRHCHSTLEAGVDLLASNSSGIVHVLRN